MTIPAKSSVAVNITRETQFPTSEGFGTLLIVTSDSSGAVDATTRTKVYTGMSEIAIDYDSQTEPYKAATTAFSQNPSPSIIKIGFRAGATSKQTYSVTASGVIEADDIFSVTIKNVNYSFTAVAGSLAPLDVATGLKLLIDNGNQLVGSVLNGDALEITSNYDYDINFSVIAGDGGGGDLTQDLSGVEVAGVYPAIIDELEAISVFDDNWYGLAFTREMRDNAKIVDIAVWTEARIKLFGTTNNDILTENAADTTNVSFLLANVGYDRTASYYHRDEIYYPEIADFVGALAADFSIAGSAYTRKFKPLAGIPTVPLTSAELLAVTGFIAGSGLTKEQGHLANTYVRVGSGFEWNVEGNVSKGEFLDVIHFIDWLTAEITNENLIILSSESGVQYTDVGLQDLVGATRTALERGVNARGIASTLNDKGDLLPAYEVSIPSVISASATDRANRIAPSQIFSARLAGAVHYTTITGTITI